VAEAVAVAVVGEAVPIQPTMKITRTVAVVKKEKEPRLPRLPRLPPPRHQRRRLFHDAHPPENEWT
jgi:hypothetical protein